MKLPLLTITLSVISSNFVSDKFNAYIFPQEGQKCHNPMVKSRQECQLIGVYCRWDDNKCEATFQRQNSHIICPTRKDQESCEKLENEMTDACKWNHKNNECIQKLFTGREFWFGPVHILKNAAKNSG